jgi:phosphoribosylglycinamide formyltransferase-1
MVRESKSSRLRIGVLISGRGSNLRSLIDHFGPLRADAGGEIAMVVSNRAEAPGLAFAAEAGIPHLVIDQKDYGARAEFDHALDAALEEAGVQLVALAGFMRILGGNFIDSWRDRLINIHPSLLPAFKGLDTHRRAIEAGVRFHGCTVHFVRKELDAGPIIAQAAVPVLAGDNEASLARRVLMAEHRLYPSAVRLIAEGKVSVIDEIARIEGAAFADGSWFNPLGA